MPDSFAPVLAAFIAAGGGSAVGSILTSHFEKKREESRRHQRVIKRYLLQLQDTVDSLWFRRLKFLGNRVTTTPPPTKIQSPDDFVSELHAKPDRCGGRQ